MSCLSLSKVTVIQSREEFETTTQNDLLDDSNKRKIEALWEENRGYVFNQVEFPFEQVAKDSKTHAFSKMIEDLIRNSQLLWKLLCPSSTCTSTSSSAKLTAFACCLQSEQIWWTRACVATRQAPFQPPGGLASSAVLAYQPRAGRTRQLLTNNWPPLPIFFRNQ